MGMTNWGWPGQYEDLIKLFNQFRTQDPKVPVYLAGDNYGVFKNDRSNFTNPNFRTC